MPTPTSRPRLPWLLLAVLVLTSVNYFVWLWGHDLSTLESETTKHLLKSYEMHVAFQHGDWGEALNTRPYPPLFYLPAAALYSLCGFRTESLALLSLLPFILLSVLGVYGLGCVLRLPRWECASAAFLCATYASVRVPYAGYVGEYAVMPCVILALWFLVASDFLANRRLSLLFALCCGLGLLAKWMFVLYVILGLPLVLVLLWRRPAQRQSRALNLGLVLVAITLIALPWYAAHHRHGHTDDGSNFHEVLSYFQQSLDTDIAIVSRARSQATSSEETTLSTDWKRAYVLQFAHYASTQILPPHLTALLVLGLLAFGYQTWRGYCTQASFWCLFLCPIFALFVFFTYPTIDYFNPADAPQRYASVWVPLAALFCVMIFPHLPRGRRFLLVLLNLITFAYALGWYFPDSVRLYESCWFRPPVHGSDRLIFADPCGWFTAPKRSALEQLAARLDNYVIQGYQPAFIVGVHQDYQPLFAHLYGISQQRSSGDNFEIPVATYEEGHWQYLSCFSQHRVDPDLTWRQRPFIFIYQDHLPRQDSNKPRLRLLADNCRLDGQNLGLLQRMLRFRLIDSAPLVVPRLNCHEVYYYSTHSPLADPLRPQEEDKELHIPFPANPPSTGDHRRL